MSAACRALSDLSLVDFGVGPGLLLDLTKLTRRIDLRCNYNNGLFHLAATAGLDAHNTYILHIEPKYKKNNKI